MRHHVPPGVVATGRHVVSSPFGAAAWTLKSIPSLVAEYWSDLGTTIVTGVSAWADQSGVSGVPWVQATDASQPALDPTGWVDGGPAIVFDGTADFMTANGLAAYLTGANTPFTWMILWEPIAPAAPDDMLLNFYGSPADWEIYQIQSGGNKLLYVARGDVVAYKLKLGPGISTRQLNTIQYAGTVLNTWVDSTPSIVAEAWDLATATITNVCLARYGPAAIYHCALKLAHMSLYAGVPSAADLAAAQAYIIARRGV